MGQEIDKKAFNHSAQWRGFTMIWLTVFIWCLFLAYMLLFHFQRHRFEPLVMHYFEIQQPSYYLFIELQLFLYLLWSSFTVAILTLVNAWGIKCQLGQRITDKLLIALMVVTVSFAFYYAERDLHYFSEQLFSVSDYFSIDSYVLDNAT